MIRYCGVKENPVKLPDGILSSSVEYTLFPGFCDVHVHFREPGFSYKETVACGSRAAARGGFTDVCTMPNLNPVPDSAEHLQEQLGIIRRDAVIGVHPFGAVTVGENGKELAALTAMAPSCIGFSDDGKGVQSASLMREAMTLAKKLGKIISAHCEDMSVPTGVIHTCAFAEEYNLPAIPSESEWRMIERDIRLAKETGCAYHVCHISCKESVALIRQAKKDGVDITCETAPHYLALDTTDLIDHGRFKMKPPIAEPADREALIEGLLDGTIDMIATDHAPHSEEEKSKGLTGSAFGVTGIEVAFPVCYTALVKTGILSLEALIKLLSGNPRRRFQIPESGYSLWDLNASYEIDPASFLSMGRSTPFEGRTVYGKNLLTIYNGRTVYGEKE